MQGQRLILFALSITIIHATKINFFDAYVYTLVTGNQSTVYDTHIELWSDVTECSSAPCSCQVQTNATNGKVYNMTFLTVNMGNVDIENLQPDTVYSFSLNCEGSAESITRVIQTDYGIPSRPQNIKVVLNVKHLMVSWEPPLTPAGPIDSYRLTINKNPTIYNISRDQSSYQMEEDYDAGTQYTFYVLACNNNRHNDIVCSKPNEGEVTFDASVTTTPTVPTQQPNTTPNSSSILSYSISFSIFVFSFLLFTHIKY